MSEQPNNIDPLFEARQQLGDQMNRIARKALSYDMKPKLSWKEEAFLKDREPLNCDLGQDQWLVRGKDSNGKYSYEVSGIPAITTGYGHNIVALGNRYDAKGFNKEDTTLPSGSPERSKFLLKIHRHLDELTKPQADILVADDRS